MSDDAVAHERSAIRSDVAGYDAQTLRAIRDDYLRDGYRLVPGVLTAEECAALRDAVDRVFERCAGEGPDRWQNPFLLKRIFELDVIFEDLLTREPIIGLAEHIVGRDCRLVSNNVIRNQPGQAIDKWHIDRIPIFPVSEGMARHDRRWVMPAPMTNVQVMLTDVPSAEFGPSQYVPTSQYSGRDVPTETGPISFDGREPVSVFWRAGDIVLHNLFCWHRGTPNTSDRTRYMINITYGARYIAHSFEGGNQYRVPEHVLANADERRRRLLT